MTARFSFSARTECFVATFVVVFIAISLRLAELPQWMSPVFFVNGGHLMATHDAYAWLGSAQGIGNWISDPFTRVIAFAHMVSGLPLDVIGFWAPVLFVPLLAVPVCMLAMRLGLAEGGIIFGILVTSGLGFLVRTRLGFCDTDILNMLFPVSMLCVLATWLEELRSASSREERGPDSWRNFALAAAAGACGRMAIYFYPGSSSILLPSLGLTALLGFGLLRGDARQRFVSGLLVVFGIAFAGWIGLGLAVAWMGCALLVLPRQTLAPLGRMMLMGAVLLLMAACSDVYILVQGLIYRLYLYAKVGTPDMTNNATGLRLPDIAQSVREAQALEWNLLGPRLAGNWLNFGLGLAGFGFVVWRRPALLLFLSYLGLGLASVKFGNRFAMYGTVGIGLGLGLGLSELMRVLKQGQGRRWIAQLLLACLVLWPSANFMQEAEPIPVLPQTYAQTLADLKVKTEPDSLLWQWWDYGYAAQYYAARATMGDGARQSGPWLYPLARVHCATSPHQAAQLIRYFGQAMLSDGLHNTTNTVQALFTGNPVAELGRMNAADAKVFIDSLATRQIPAAMIPQYFTVSWENLRLAAWISYYGYWDVVAGTSAHGRIQQLQGAVQVDSQTGSLVLNGKAMPVDSLDVIEDKATRHFGWPNGSGMHLLINQTTRQVFIMEDKVYQTMMVQMLIQPPAQFESDFTLVADNYPWTRVYKVR